MTQAVGKSPYGKVIGFDGVLHLGDELMVGYRCPRFGGPGRFHLFHISPRGEICAAMQDEVGMMFPLTRRFELLDHVDVSFFFWAEAPCLRAEND